MNTPESSFVRRITTASLVTALGFTAAACGGSPSAEKSNPTTSASSSPSPSRSSPSTAPQPSSRYPRHRVIATEFWVGESASQANAGIDNKSTEWESDAQKHLGGYDDPDHRAKGGLPLFKPKENPFYCAVPMSEFGKKVNTEQVRADSPWAAEAKKLPGDDSRSLFKGRWIEVERPDGKGKTYCQWLDTGPTNDANAAHDPAYVWGHKQPKNYPHIIHGAGIDLSPATAYHALGETSQDVSGEVTWNFVDRQDVPDGPWKQFPPIDNRTDWE